MKTEQIRELLITYSRHLRMKLGLFGMYNLKDTTDWSDEFLKDNKTILQHLKTEFNEELEYKIRNILSLHLNNFYQENGLSVPCKIRTKTEDKIIEAIKEELK